VPERTLSPMAKLDPKDAQKRIDRISEIFSEIVSHAETLSQIRCPYRDRNDHCTAEFRCRNQRAPVAEDSPHGCGHDGNFDYRNAWESRPLERDRIKEKVRDIRNDAARRRRQMRHKK